MMRGKRSEDVEGCLENDLCKMIRMRKTAKPAFSTRVKMTLQRSRECGLRTRIWRVVITGR